MKARVGDWLIVEGPTADGPRRLGEILAVEHEDGTPPYRVRWTGSDGEALVFPGPDAHVQPRAEFEAANRR